MSTNSIITNQGAQIALQALNSTNAQLDTVQKQISTGYRVNDATDDGAAFAVAQSVRGATSALTSANQQLGNATGILATTLSTLNQVSNELITMKALLVKLSDASLSTSERAQYQQQYSTDLSAVQGYLADSVYNGVTLIGTLTATGTYSQTGTPTTLSVVRNENGQQFSVTAFASAQQFLTYLTITTQTTSTLVAAYLASTGTTSFTSQINNIGTQLNKFGAANTYLNSQITYNNDKIDALNTGLGALVDADLAQESATLQSLQIRQQLGTQALSIANSSPSALLTLVKNA